MLDGDPVSAGHDRLDGVAPASNRDFWLPAKLFAGALGEIQTSPKNP
jgi:hypothetical protein